MESADSSWLCTEKDRIAQSSVTRFVHFNSLSLSHGESQLIRVWQVGFNKGFDFVKGGKLPGLYGGDTNAHCTGGQNSETCFSLRREHHLLRLTRAEIIVLLDLLLW